MFASLFAGFLKNDYYRGYAMSREKICGCEKTVRTLPAHVRSAGEHDGARLYGPH